MHTHMKFSSHTLYSDSTMKIASQSNALYFFSGKIFTQCRFREITRRVNTKFCYEEWGFSFAEVGLFLRIKPHIEPFLKQAGKHNVTSQQNSNIAVTAGLCEMELSPLREKQGLKLQYKSINLFDSSNCLIFTFLKVWFFLL